MEQRRKAIQTGRTLCGNSVLFPLRLPMCTINLPSKTRITYLQVILSFRLLSSPAKEFTSITQTCENYSCNNATTSDSPKNISGNRPDFQFFSSRYQYTKSNASNTKSILISKGRMLWKVLSVKLTMRVTNHQFNELVALDIFKNNYFSPNPKAWSNHNLQFIS